MISSLVSFLRSRRSRFVASTLLGVALVIMVSRLSPAWGQEEKTISVDFRAIDVVQASQLVSNHFSLNLIVLAGVEGPLSFTGTAMKRQAALNTLEKNSGFPVLDAAPWMIVFPAGAQPLLENGLPSSTLPEIAALAETVSMDFRSLPLATALTLIAKKAGIELKLNTPVPGKVGAIRIVDQPIREVLSVLGAVTGLRFTIIDNPGSTPILEVGRE